MWENEGNEILNILFLSKYFRLSLFYSNLSIWGIFMNLTWTEK